MKFTLYRIETYGMKNIQNLITINFFPTIIKNQPKKKISNVKSIYGSNGVGKSAIINSISLFKQITLNSLLLKQNEEIAKLNKIINKIKKEFFISVIYGFDLENENETFVFKSDLMIKLENSIPYIAFEKMYILNDVSLNGDYSLIYESINGNLKFGTLKEDNLIEYFKEKTMNILKYSTCTSMLEEPEIYNNIINQLNYNKNNKASINPLFYLFINKAFADNISIFLENKDIHNEFENDYIEKIINGNADKITKMIIRNSIGSSKDVILKDKLDLYQKNIKRMFEFLKLFKPGLKDIRIEYTEDENYYFCSKKMVYQNFEVDSDYESTGIQKLMKIYNSIEDVTNGKIVFIDELDANINGVYLNRLLEYLISKKSGQLCFTTHNFISMECLYLYSNAIDFLGETGKLVSWKKNGNYKPYNLYPNGMIVDSPFNIDSIDFMKIFEGDK